MRNLMLAALVAFTPFTAAAQEVCAPAGQMRNILRADLGMSALFELQQNGAQLILAANIDSGDWVIIEVRGEIWCGLFGGGGFGTYHSGEGA